MRKADFPEAFAHAELENYAPRFNGSVIAAAWQYVREFIPGQTSLGVMFTGTVGTGKTHLAIAIARALVREKGIEARFVAMSELLDRLRASFDPSSQQTRTEIVAKILSADLIILDELGAARPNDFVFETQDTLVGYLYNAMRPVIVTTNLPNLGDGAAADANSYARAARPETLGDRIGARMFSRLQQMCVEFKTQGPDWRARARKDLDAGTQI